MGLRGFEPRSTGPKPGILSIELQAHIKLMKKSYLKVLLLLYLPKRGKNEQKNIKNGLLEVGYNLFYRQYSLVSGFLHPNMSIM